MSDNKKALKKRVRCPLEPPGWERQRSLGRLNRIASEPDLSKIGKETEIYSDSGLECTVDAPSAEDEQNEESDAPSTDEQDEETECTVDAPSAEDLQNEEFDAPFAEDEQDEESECTVVEDELTDILSQLATGLLIQTSLIGKDNSSSLEATITNTATQPSSPTNTAVHESSTRSFISHSDSKTVTGNPEGIDGDPRLVGNTFYSQEAITMSLNRAGRRRKTHYNG